MQQYLHNDTEFIGNIKVLLTDKNTDILCADENVFSFFNIGNSNGNALANIIELNRYNREIREIASVRNSFNLILKNSCGYFDAVFTVEKKSESIIALNIMLFKSHETDTVLVAASLSADSIFRYDPKTGKMYLYTNRGGEFAFAQCIDDFENYFLEKNIVHADDAEIFSKFCHDIYEGRNGINYNIRLYDGKAHTFPLYSLKAQASGIGEDENIMGLIVNISEDAKQPESIDAANYDFEKEITEFAFDLMDKAVDAGEAAEMLLSRLGKHFGLDRIYILEEGALPCSLKTAYSYCSAPEYRAKEEAEFTDNSKWELMLSMFDHSGIILSDDMDNENVPDILKSFSVSPSGKAKTALYSVLSNNGSFKGILCCESFRESRQWKEKDISAIKNMSRIFSSFLFKMREYQNAGKTIDRLTNYDKLTGMPNFNKFKRIAEETLQMEENPENLSIIFYDINNFKYINEKYGEENGDRILKDFALNISPQKFDAVFSSRVFSDKFVSLVRCPKENLADMALSAVDRFVYNEKLRQTGLNITFSCGLYTFTDKNTDISSAVDNATLASKSGRNMTETTCSVYCEEMSSVMKEEIELLNNAMRGLINREFVVYYQPKVALSNSKLVGGEALVRWRRSDGTMVPPGDFIPCLEKNGFITALDFYVYEEVCRFIRSRLDKKLPVVPISVNVSVLHLKEEGFLDRIKSLVKNYNIPSHLLEFELTESIFLENQQAALDIMENMKDLGFLVSIDDFGSGFSSLNLLKSLPVDILKIDKEFFANDTLLNNDQIILSSIINMASRLHISVICEGVETVNQIHFLKENNCDMVQGYFYSKPVEERVFADYNSNTDFHKEEE